MSSKSPQRERHLTSPETVALNWENLTKSEVMGLSATVTFTEAGVKVNDGESFSMTGCKKNLR